MRFAGATLSLFLIAGSLAAQQNASPGSPPNSSSTAQASSTTSVAPPSSPTQQTSDSPAPASTSPTNQAPIAPAINQTPTSADAAQPNIAPGQPASFILPTVTKKEAAEAKRQFREGVHFKSKGDLDSAYGKFASASELDPTNYDYATAREFTRQELAYRSLQRGNKAMLENQEIIAMAEFRRALQYDPTNEYAMQRLRDAVPEEEVLAHKLSVVEKSAPIELQPAVAHKDFHFRGDSRALLTEVTRAYGITATFDDSVKSQRVHFDIQDVNFATAIGAAQAVTKTFVVPLSAKQVFVLNDTAENRRNFERMGLRTFYVPELTDQQLNELTTSMRVLLNLRFVSMDKSNSTITVRAELPLLEAADQMVRSLTAGRPEVLLDINVYAVSTSFARSLGTALPTQFNLFNISPALLAGLGQNAQNLINQLIASGGINAANSTAISALLAQLQNSSTSSILSQPFATFGGGLTLFGLTGGNTGVMPTFSLNRSDIQNLEHVTLRASHNDPAVMKIGERYPIINATFAPIYNTTAVAQVIGNQSYIAPFPSFNFEDLGVNLKATPSIHGNHDVTLKLELQLRSLGTQNVNGIPIINNREYSGMITVKDGESSVVTGLIDMNDTRSLNGYPFLGQVPGLSYASSVHNKNVTGDELLVVITPHVVRSPEPTSFAVTLPPAH